MNNREKGAFGEEEACKFLKKQGFRILARNFSLRGGEIDIIGYRRRVLVFFEVKTRSSDAWGTPAEAIDEEKMNRVAFAAAGFRKMYCGNGKIDLPILFGISVPRPVSASRIDGVEVYLTREGSVREIRRIENMREL